MENSLSHYILLLLLSVVFLAVSCTQKPVSYEEYIKWMSNPDNGMVKTHAANGLEVKVKILPKEYQVYQELKNDNNSSPTKRDSLLKYYSKSLTFLMTIGPDESKKNAGDVMMNGVSNYEEFAQKAMTMNFDMGQYITLKTDAGDFKPVLANMENVYGLSKSRNIILVFAPAEEKDTAFLHSSQFDLVYEDELFKVGINHFVFKTEEIEKRPILAL